MTKIDSALKKMQKKYDSGVIMDLRKQDRLPKIERIPVPSPKIGEILGFGGYPRGRILEVYGAESSGKTSFVTYLAGVCQNTTFYDEDEKTGELTERKGMVLFIDAEHAFDLDFARVHNFDMNRCILVQPDNGEQALDIAIEFINTGEVDLVIIDSIAALTPIAEIEADMDQMQIGLQARMISKFLRKSMSLIAQTKTTLLCVNQTRDSIGVYGNPIATPGGKSLKFYSSIRIEVKRKEFIKEKDIPIGLMIAMRTVKNKTAPPGKKCLVEMSFTRGFDARLEWIDFAIQYDVVQNPSQGSFLLLNGNKMRGKQNVIDYYSDPANAEEYEEVIKKTQERLYATLTTSRVSVDDPDEEKEVEEIESFEAEEE